MTSFEHATLRCLGVLLHTLTGGPISHTWHISSWARSLFLTETSELHPSISAWHLGPPQDHPPTLSSLGPDTELAAALLKHGEKRAVVDYLRAMREVWRRSEEHTSELQSLAYLV